MNKAETASALRYFVDELIRADRVVQHGGEFGIAEGTDKRGRGDPIGDVMYRDGCPWRADPSECRSAHSPRQPTQSAACGAQRRAQPLTRPADRSKDGG
eukprot:804796-Rhodomonas_salina.2